MHHFEPILQAAKLPATLSQPDKAQRPEFLAAALVHKVAGVSPAAALLFCKRSRDEMYNALKLKSLKWLPEHLPLPVMQPRQQ